MVNEEYGNYRYKTLYSVLILCRCQQYTGDVVTGIIYSHWQNNCGFPNIIVVFL